MIELGPAFCIVASCWEHWVVTRHFNSAASMGIRYEWRRGKRKLQGLVRVDEWKLCGSSFQLKSVILSPGSYWKRAVCLLVHAQLSVLWVFFNLCSFILLISKGYYKWKWTTELPFLNTQNLVQQTCIWTWRRLESKSDPEPKHLIISQYRYCIFIKTKWPRFLLDVLFIASRLLIKVRCGLMHRLTNTVA